MQTISVAVLALAIGYGIGTQHQQPVSTLAHRGPISASDHTIVDISVPLMNGIASDPPGGRPSIEYVDHNSSFDALAVGRKAYALLQ